MSASIHKPTNRTPLATERAALGAGELAGAARVHLLPLLAAIAAAWVMLLMIDGPRGDAAATAGSKAAPLQASAGARELVRERGFSLTMPPGWVRTEAPRGAVFAASSANGSARSILWVQRDRGLSFGAFVAQSLAGLEQLGGQARIGHRVNGPGIEASSVQLRARVPLDGRPPGPYLVTLRASGADRYYLATALDPAAAPPLLAKSKLVGSSLRPTSAVAAAEPAAAGSAPR